MNVGLIQVPVFTNRAASAAHLSALYESIAAHARLGLNVVVDVGHHESNNPGVLADCARTNSSAVCAPSPIGSVASM